MCPAVRSRAAISLLFYYVAFIAPTPSRTALTSSPSRARRAARAPRRDFSIPPVSGCDPPSTRRAVRSVPSSVVMASWRSLT